MTTLAETSTGFQQWVGQAEASGAVVTGLFRDDPTSQHSLGLAADFGYASNTSMALDQVRRSAREAGYTVVEEPNAPRGAHTHVQAFPGGFLARCGVLTPRV